MPSQGEEVAVFGNLARGNGAAADRGQESNFVAIG
jgi:hypothetical protein